jgi:ketosteroid isomerase-like protein
MSANYKQIVEKINDSFSEGNIEGFLEHCKDDVTWRIVGEKTVTGKDATREFMKSTGGTIPDFTVDKIVAEGDSVVTYGDMTMTDPSDGKTKTYSYCDVYRFEGDKIAELNSFVVKIADAAQAEAA